MGKIVAFLKFESCSADLAVIAIPPVFRNSSFSISPVVPQISLMPASNLKGLNEESLRLVLVSRICQSSRQHLMYQGQ